MDTASIERLARCFVHPVLIGAEADRAVSAIAAWGEANPDADEAKRWRDWCWIEQATA